MSASEILFGHILNEKKGFTVDSAAKTSILLLECSMPHATVLCFLLACFRSAGNRFGIWRLGNVRCERSNWMLCDTTLMGTALCACLSLDELNS